jgi:hypothetical protein
MARSCKFRSATLRRPFRLPNRSPFTTAAFIPDLLSRSVLKVAKPSSLGRSSSLTQLRSGSWRKVLANSSYCAPGVPITIRQLLVRCGPEPWSTTATNVNSLPGSHEFPRLPIVGNGKSQKCGLLGRGHAIDELSSLHVSPQIVRAVSSVRIVGTTAVRFAADHHAALCGTAAIPAMPRTARPLVCLSRAIAVGGRLDRRVGVEHVAHRAPGGQATEEHGRGQRRTHRLT